MAHGAMTTPFVARAAELAALTDALGRAAAGDPSLVLVGADAGVGKTRLLRRAAELAEAAGAVVVTVHCVDLGEIGLPYLPFAEALARLRELDPATVDAAVAARPVLRRLVPTARALVPAGAGAPGSAAAPPPGAAADPEDQSGRLQLFDGITAVLGAVGRPGAPLLLVIEDLHWADTSSGDVLRFLVARLRAEHLVVVASYRTDDLHRRHPLRPMLTEMTRHPRVRRIDLPAFTRDELREFTTAANGGPLPERELDRVAARSEGNAYFAEELLDCTSGTDALPWTLVDVLRGRLETLDPAVQRLARIASVEGRRVSEPLLRAVATLERGTRGGSPGEPAFDDTLREALARHVLGGEDGQIAFRHALLAEAVYSDLLPGEQVALHRAYLRAIQDDPTLGTPSRLAAHALRAHDLPTAVRASSVAAGEAARVLAPAEELRHLETVLSLWDAVADPAGLVGADRGTTVTRAADAASRAGQIGRAVTLARDAVETTAGDVGLQAALRTVLARYLLGADREREALAEADRALTDLPADAPPRARAWALATHARACVGVDHDEDARASATSAVAIAREHAVPDAEADALATLAVLVVDDPDRAATLLTQAADRARASGNLVTEQRCAYNLATTLYYAGRLGDAAAAIDAAIARAGATGLVWTEFGVVLPFFAELVRYSRGDLAPAPSRPGPRVELQPGLMDAVALYSAVARGDHDAVPRGRALEPGRGRDPQVALISGGCLVDALVWAGALDEAVDLADRLIEHLGRTWTDVFLGSIWLAALALAALADMAEDLRLHGDEPAAVVARGTLLLDRAVRVAERGRPRGGRLGPEGRAWLARAHAEHSRLAGAHDPELWRAATEAFGYGYRYEVARSRWRWAQALLGAGERADAATQAVVALAEAEQMGARPLADAVRDLARRGRLDLPGVRLGSTDVLTTREAEVLGLVARGLSNRQIGEVLYISGKTVSVHVSNLLAKLGASGRTEAVTIAHRRGLLDAS